MKSQDPSTLLSGINDARQQTSILQSQVEDLTPSSKVPELAEIKYYALKTTATLDSLFEDLSTAIQTGNLAQLEEIQKKVSELDNNTDGIKLEQLQRSLQLKYNITDTEIDANTSTDVPERLGYVPSPAPPPYEWPPPAPAPTPAPTPAPALSSVYDGTYVGTFKFRCPRQPVSHTEPWIIHTMRVTVDLRTRSIENGEVTLDVTQVLCSDWGFGALNGVSPRPNPPGPASIMILPANPPIEGTTKCAMIVYFPNGAQLEIYEGKQSENYVSLDGETLSGTDWRCKNVQSEPLSTGECVFMGWDFIKQTGPDVWG